MVKHSSQTLGTPDEWRPPLSGWQGEVEAALIDAVFSTRARYGKPDSGVRGVVQKWRMAVGRPLDDLAQLVTDVEERGGVAQLPDVLRNHQRAPGPGASAATKAATMFQAAKLLSGHGFTNAASVLQDLPEPGRRLKRHRPCRSTSLTGRSLSAAGQFTVLLSSNPLTRSTALAQKMVVELTDDLTGKPIKDGKGETVRFSLDGQSYEMDLNDKNAEKLRAVIEEYKTHARRAPSSSRTKDSARGLRNRSGIDPSAVRAWASSNGIEVNSRGRVPSAVIDQFRAAGN